MLIRLPDAAQWVWPTGRAGLTSCAAALIGATILSGCIAAAQAGTAIQEPYATSIGAKPIRPGTELGWLYLYLDNTSKSALVITAVGVRGPGVGTVVRPVEVKVAPLRSGFHHYYILNGTPGGQYMTDPPVNIGGKGCHKQALFPVRGYRMTPGSQVRIYIVLRALRPGRYAVPFQVIDYTQHRVRYRQSMPVRFWGSVADNARRIPMDPAEAVCVRPTGARVLTGWQRRNAGRT